MKSPTDQIAPPPLLAAHRLGPRMLTWTSSHAACRSLGHGSPPWSREPLQTVQLLQADLGRYLQDAAPTDNSQAETDGDAWATFLAAMDDEIQPRLNTLLDGIQAYRRHPYRRADTSAEVV